MNKMGSFEPRKILSFNPERKENAGSIFLVEADPAHPFMSIYMLRQSLPLFKCTGSNDGTLTGTSHVQKRLQSFYCGAVSKNSTAFKSMHCPLCGCSKFYFNGTYPKKIKTDNDEITLNIQRIRCSSPSCNQTYCLYTRGMIAHEKFSVDQLYRISEEDLLNDTSDVEGRYIITKEMIRRKRRKYTLFWIYIRSTITTADEEIRSDTLLSEFMNLYTPGVRFSLCF